MEAAGPHRAAPLTTGGSGAVKADPAANVRALLTEEKVGKYAVYQKIIATAGADARKAVSKEDGSGGLGGSAGQRLVAVMQKALAESGLTQQEATTLTSVLASHMARRMVLAEARKALEKASGPLKEVYEKQVAKGEAERKEFGEKYGAAALAAVDKHEAALLEAQAAMLKSFLGGGRRR